MEHWGYNGNKAFYLPSKLLEFELHLLRQKKKKKLWKHVKEYIQENKLQE